MTNFILFLIDKLRYVIYFHIVYTCADDELRLMIEESDSEYEEDSLDASVDENYIPAANGGTGTQEDSDIEQK